ncbi:MAG: hypothetical protein V4604_12735 [Bacteroidota bacterium]
MKSAALFISLFWIATFYAQWSGTYYGTVNGDAIVMNLLQDGTKVSGDMNDSQQTYVISGTTTGNSFSGTAVESTYALNFGLTAERSDAVLNCKLIIEMNGERTEVPFTVEKAIAKETETASTQTEKTPEKIPFPANVTFPMALQGKWTKSETYNSGNGDNYMGSTFSQSITFYADGSISDNGSSATMSGSDYSGQSAHAGNGKIPGVGWYTKEKNLYLIAYAEGKWQSVLVGTWYTENNALLITGSNGNKELFTR